MSPGNTSYLIFPCFLLCSSDQSPLTSLSSSLSQPGPTLPRSPQLHFTSILIIPKDLPNLRLSLDSHVGRTHRPTHTLHKLSRVRDCQVIYGPKHDLYNVVGKSGESVGHPTHECLLFDLLKGFQYVDHPLSPLSVGPDE